MDLAGGPRPPRPGHRFQDISTGQSASRHDDASGARGSLEQQKLDLLGPAYVLERTRQRQYSRRRIADAEELRASIDQWGSDEPYARRLFVLQGLPVEYLQVLRDTLDIDPRFAEAHVGRRSYRPWVGHRRRRDDAANSTSFACFEYPELLSSSHVPPHSDDTVDKPPAHVTFANGDTAVFCSASLWSSPKADVLLLDRPLRTQPSPRPDNTPYRSSELSRASTMGEINKFRNNPSHGNKDNYASSDDQTASFETLLYENLPEEWREEPSEDKLGSLIEDIAIHQWTEFFEALSTILGPGTAETTTTVLYWQMQKSLEKNLSNSEFYDKSFRPSHFSSSASSAISDWQSLLSRLVRRVELSRQLAPPSVTTIEIPSSTQPPQSGSTAFEPPMTHRNNNNSNANSSSSAEKNQHSLDRVSYMGGVLLPLSIVSSILSMSDPFNPGGPMFFVFWAVSVPLVFVTVFIIYADSIRKVEVWIEVAAGGGAGSDVENPEDSDHGRSSGAVPYGATVELPIVEPKAGRVMGRAALGEGYIVHPGADGGSFDEPSMMAEKMFNKPSSSRRKWQKQQLGWKGACMTAFQLYKLKKGRPPNWAGTARRQTD
ncbi:hypothetical protein F4818DRAFT_23082 [Hypoxylon cercidicola]|nr:hypothetical protein F4818DRAFT_23082 [Hypoxylon cercidicola]